MHIAAIDRRTRTPKIKKHCSESIFLWYPVRQDSIFLFCCCLWFSVDDKKPWAHATWIYLFIYFHTAKLSSTFSPAPKPSTTKPPSPQITPHSTPLCHQNYPIRILPSSQFLPRRCSLRSARLNCRSIFSHSRKNSFVNYQVLFLVYISFFVSVASAILKFI